MGEIVYKSLLYREHVRTANVENVQTRAVQKHQNKVLKHKTASQLWNYLFIFE